MYYVKEENKELKSIEEVAQEVLKGNYGNNPERKKKLESEGYNYSEVQTRVNELVSEKNSIKEYYVIKKGDTLTKISKKYNTSVNQLIEWNNIKNKNKIYAGTKIRVK